MSEKLGDYNMEDFEKIILPSEREVEIKELTAEAERILTNKADVKSGRWLNKFIAHAIASIDGRVVENNGELINILLDMKTGDRNYLLLRIRMQSYGTKLVFNYQCPQCKKTSGYELDLQEMLDNEILKVYPYRKDVPITVETRGGIAEIDYMTGRSEQWLAMQENIDTIHIAMASCKTFNGKTPEYKDFKNLFTKDITAIRMAAADLKGGLEAQIKLECPECDNEYSVMLYQIPDFFTPITSLENIGQ